MKLQFEITAEAALSLAEYEGRCATAGLQLLNKLQEGQSIKMHKSTILPALLEFALKNAPPETIMRIANNLPVPAIAKTKK